MFQNFKISLQHVGGYNTFYFYFFKPKLGAGSEHVLWDYGRFFQEKNWEWFSHFRKTGVKVTNGFDAFRLGVGDVGICGHPCLGP